MNKNNLSLSSFILFGSFIIGIVFTLLFYNQSSTGLGFLLFYLTLLVFTLTAKFIKFGGLKFHIVDLYYILLLFCSAVPFISQNGSLNFFSVIITLGGFYLVTLYSIWEEKINSFTFFNNIKMWALHFAAQFVGIGNLFKPFAKMEFKIKSKNVNFIKIFIGILFSLPILLIYLILFASSDDLFSKLLSNLAFWNFLRIDNIWSIGWLVTIIFGITLFVYSGFFFFENKLKNSEIDFKGFFDPIISTTISIVINSLFVLFIITQFIYLFGDRQTTINLGIVYSDYAHRGFIEMLIIGIFSTLVILGIKTFTQKEKSLTTTILNASLLMNSAFNIIILISATKRLALYTDGYGLTEDRFYVYAIIAFIALIFIFFIGGLIIDLIRLEMNSEIKKSILSYTALFGFTLSLIFIPVLGIINPDATIAAINIDRFNYRIASKVVHNPIDVDDIDVNYLTYLSSDSYAKLLTTENIHLTNTEQRCYMAWNWIKEEQSRSNLSSFNIYRLSNKDLVQGALKNYIEGDHLSATCNDYPIYEGG